MDNENTDEGGWKLPVGLGAAVLIVWASSGFAVWSQLANVERGTFGDMFGAVNALFSGLAFAGVIYAIMLQRKELQLQRFELRLTRDELSGQKEQLRAQNETLKQQNFENTFFQLLRLHNDIVASIKLRDVALELRGAVPITPVAIEGRGCFETIFSRLKRHAVGFQNHVIGTDSERINTMYLAFYPEIEADLGHYFRSLYNIVKFVDSSSAENKRIYTNLVRAQLSKYELAILLYNCVSDKGSDKFLPLVKRYDLLKMVPEDDLIESREANLVRPLNPGVRQA